VILGRYSERRDTAVVSWVTGAAPTPSAVDHREMRDIAASAANNCPEPVLLIIGGHPPGPWSASAHVFRRAGEVVELARA